MVPKIWIIESLKMYKISDKIINFITKGMESTVSGQTLAMVKIQRGIFQGDLLSLLLFIIAKKPLNYILKKWTWGHKFTKSLENINHFMYVDDIKVFSKSEKRRLTLQNTLHPRDDIDCMYQKKKKKKGEIGLATIEDCVDVSMQGLGGDIKKTRDN